MDHFISLFLDVECELRMAPFFIGFRTMTQDYMTHDRKLPEHELVLIDSGKLTGTVDGSNVTLNNGDILWLAPDTPHSLLWSEGLKFYRIRFSLLRTQNSLLPRMTNWSLIKKRLCAKYFLRIIDEQNHRKNPYKVIRLRSLFAVFFSDFCEFQEPECQSKEFNRKFTAEQGKALQKFIVENLNRRHDVKELAKFMGFSYDYFYRMFFASMGISPRDWILQQRISLAISKLQETDLNITCIAAELGYKDIYLFSRQFKQQTGLSPAAYRQKFKD
jgi:AraC-like DNA-binding protein